MDLTVPQPDLEDIETALLSVEGIVENQKEIEFSCCQRILDYLDYLIGSTQERQHVNMYHHELIHVAVVEEHIDIVKHMLTYKLNDLKDPRIIAYCFGNTLKDLLESLLRVQRSMEAEKNRQTDNVDSKLLNFKIKLDSKIASLLDAVKSNLIKNSANNILSNSFIPPTSSFNVNAKNHVGKTPLHYAKSEDMALLLLDNGAELEAKDDYGTTPLMAAARPPSLMILYSTPTETLYYDAIDLKEVIVPLLKNKAKVNAKNNSGSTVLHEAVYADCRFRVSTLIQYGSDVRAINDKGETPLHFALSADIAELLLKKGASIAATDYKGLTALHQAISSRGDKLVKLLIRNWTDLSVDSVEGRPLLYRALCHQRSLKIIRCLLSNGANSKPSFDDDILVTSAVRKRCHYKIIECLIEYGFKVNPREWIIDSPLYRAAINGDCDIIKVLLAAGADWVEVVIELTKRKKSRSNSLEMTNIDRATRLIVQHIAKLRAAGLDEGKYDLDMSEEFRVKVNNELEKLKSFKLVNETSLLDILKTSDIPYVSEAPFKPVDFDEYPLYGGIVRSKLIRDIKSASLLETSMRYFSVLIEASDRPAKIALPRLPYELEKKILSLLKDIDLVSIMICGMSPRSFYNKPEGVSRKRPISAVE